MVFFKIALASMLIVCGFHVAASALDWTPKPTCPIEIPENTPIHSLTNFTGPMGTNNYTVLALNSTGGREFSITESGTLQTQTPFDYEKPSDRGFALNITATDGTDNATITCTIAIKDVNDVTPTFSKATYFVSVKNNTPKGTGILNVTATDGDVSTAFNTLTYSIKKFADDISKCYETGKKCSDREENIVGKGEICSLTAFSGVVCNKVVKCHELNHDKFSIDTKGAITAATNLTVPSAQNFTITVEAFDKKNTGSASVRVCVGCTTDGEKGSGAVSRASLLALVTLLLSLFVL